MLSRRLNPFSIIFAMVVAVICTVPCRVVASWTNLLNYSTEWYHEPESSFTIHSPEQLAGLAVLVNGGNDFQGKTINLIADISLSGKLWIAIGTPSNPFAGTFDGRGRNIAWMEVRSPHFPNQALFGFLGTGGILQNLSLVHSSVYGGQEFVAGLVAQNLGTIRNCINAASVSGTFRWVGGVAGRNGNHGSYALIQNSMNCGSVHGGEHVGGITGMNYSIVENCYWKKTGAEGYDINALNAGQFSVSTDNRSFGDFPGELDSIVTVGGVSTIDLLTALNSWVNANSGSNAYFYWADNHWPHGIPRPVTSTPPIATYALLMNNPSVPEIVKSSFSGVDELTFNTWTSDHNIKVPDIHSETAVFAYLANVPVDCAVHLFAGSESHPDIQLSFMANFNLSNIHGVLEVLMGDSPGNLTTVVDPREQVNMVVEDGDTSYIRISPLPGVTRKFYKARIRLPLKQ